MFDGKRQELVLGTQFVLRTPSKLTKTLKCIASPLLPSSYKEIVSNRKRAHQHKDANQDLAYNPTAAGRKNGSI
jgi:hypothetical protein